jgi:hypothetical protein
MVATTRGDFRPLDVGKPVPEAAGPSDPLAAGEFGMGRPGVWTPRPVGVKVWSDAVGRPEVRVPSLAFDGEAVVVLFSPAPLPARA